VRQRLQGRRRWQSPWAARGRKLAPGATDQSPAGTGPSTTAPGPGPGGQHRHPSGSSGGTRLVACSPPFTSPLPGGTEGDESHKWVTPFRVSILRDRRAVLYAGLRAGGYRVPNLLHGDLWTFNLLVAHSNDRPAITGVLDTDRAWWGDPMADWIMFLS